jgi:arylsulfatase A-like enzyme
MQYRLSRREALKLLPLLGLFTRLRLPALAAEGASSHFSSESPNILIVIFDTLSAMHLSLYGYERDTTPHLRRFAENATVYHAHHAAGNYTTPGTSSIFTGTYPWTHRALSHQASPLETYARRNLFSAFAGRGYTRMGFSQNLLVNILLDQMEHHLERFPLPSESALADYNVSDDLFIRDYGLAAQAERSLLTKQGKASNSLFLSPLLWGGKTAHERWLSRAMKRELPFGIPGLHNMLYPLEMSIDWLINEIGALPEPYLAYVHMMPPHSPYRPRAEFLELFAAEDIPQLEKPNHHFSEGKTKPFLARRRLRYDRFIANVDFEFGRMLGALRRRGGLNNTWIVFTSDHGEMFERGIIQHTTPVLYQPLLRVPLLIAQPGQQKRRDVYATTSCVDILPTLMHVTGREIPSWIEGRVLPPFGEEGSAHNRSIFAVEAKSSPKYQPLRKATLSMVKGDFKIIHYIGYEDGFTGVTELYNIARDPEEMNDLASSRPGLMAELLDELLAEKASADVPFRRA